MCRPPGYPPFFFVLQKWRTHHSLFHQRHCRLSVYEASLVALTFAGSCGMNVVVFPSSYGQDCRAGASVVLISSLCSILTVPIIYALTQYLFSM